MLPRDHFLLLGHLKSPYILRRLIFVQNLNILYLTLDITEGVARFLFQVWQGGKRCVLQLFHFQPSDEGRWETLKIFESKY